MVDSSIEHGPETLPPLSDEQRMMSEGYVQHINKLPDTGLPEGWEDMVVAFVGKDGKEYPPAPARWALGYCSDRFDDNLDIYDLAVMIKAGLPTSQP